MHKTSVLEANWTDQPACRGQNAVDQSYKENWYFKAHNLDKDTVQNP